MMITTPRIPTYVLVAAWAVPVLVLGGFALISGAAIATVLVGSRLRWWAAALAAVYVVPLVLWLTGPSTAPSLTQYLSPVATVLFAATGVAVAVAHQVARARPAATRARRTPA
jgi:hypothetical protein